MSRLEDLQPNAAVRGILPDALVTVVNVQWFGSEAIELTYKDPGGRVGNQQLYCHDEPRLEAQLYKAVTDYVRDEFNRAEALQNDKCAGTRRRRRRERTAALAER